MVKNTRTTHTNRPPINDALLALHGAGLRSIPRALAFLTLVDNAGHPLKDAAGAKAGSKPYQRFMHDYLSLSKGYPSGSGNGANLVRLKKDSHSKHNLIALTAKGKRLAKAIGYGPIEESTS